MKRWLREPLVHFLVLGAALFLFYEWRGGGSGPGSSRIVIGSGQIEHLAAGFARTWSRPPTEVELKGLIDDWVREEIATREAMAMGLDRDDTVLRRRLRQKLEFLVEDAAGAEPTTDAELEAWLAAHAADYAVPPEVSLRQVFVSRDRHGAGAEAIAEGLLARLREAGAAAAIEELGDPLMLPQEVEATPLDQLSRVFGADFAEAMASAPVGSWSGPVRSGFGLHLVFVRARTGVLQAELAQVRAQVERDVVSARRRSELARMYEGLLAKYTVVIERQAPAEVAKP